MVTVCQMRFPNLGLHLVLESQQQDCKFQASRATKQGFDSKANQPAIKWHSCWKLLDFTMVTFHLECLGEGDGGAENFPF